MMPNTLLHRVADWILRAGIRLAPGDAREWGNAMLGELHSIKGSWAAQACWQYRRWSLCCCPRTTAGPHPSAIRLQGRPKCTKPAC